MADKKQEKQKITGAEKKQRGLFKKKRAGVVLTKDEIKQIKAGRKKLRRDMRKMGVKDKKDFELTASSLGLYFDKNKTFALILWWFWRKGGWILLALAATLLALLYAMSYITELRGHFTVSMSDKLFRDGFVLSEVPEFINPTSHIFCTPVENVSPLSITDIPADIDASNSAHTGNFFATTYYLRNEGDEIADYAWEIRVNSESNSLSKAAWIMVFIDGKMTFYAKANEDGTPQTLPTLDDDKFAYIVAPLREHAAKPDEQYEIIHQTQAVTFWRLHPVPFESDEVVASGIHYDFEPMQVHKYTVVVWLEGDDPDCTNELIGGNLGLEIYMHHLE